MTVTATDRMAWLAALRGSGEIMMVNGLARLMFATKIWHTAHSFRYYLYCLFRVLLKVAYI